MIKGIDNKFYQLLRNDWLPSINFPEKMEAQFFGRHAKRIFLKPHRDIEEAHISAIQDGALRNLYKTTYIVEKTTSMENFIDDLLDLCFFVGEIFRDPFMRPDKVKALKNQFYRISGKNEEQVDSYRDHVLHSGYVCLWGLWLFKNFDSLQREHENMLVTKPQRGYGSGCKARIGPNKDIRWQFFQQWVITSLFHDIGRFVERETNLRKIIRRIEYINEVEKRWFNKMKKQGYNTPSRNCKTAYNSQAKKLDMELYEINYPSGRAEEYISNDMWNECLKDISKVEESLQDDHGIHSAKILLKLANFSIKDAEIYFQKNKKDPLWKRHSYRNYILPALAISRHNDTAIKKNVKIKIPGEVVIPIKIFKDDFLTTLLIVSDDLAEFDRIGGRKPLFAMDYEIKLSENKDINDIKFSIVKRE